MKSVLQSFWLLTVAFGDLIVVILSSAKPVNGVVCCNIFTTLDNFCCVKWTFTFHNCIFNTTSLSPFLSILPLSLLFLLRLSLPFLLRLLLSLSPPSPKIAALSVSSESFFVHLLSLLVVFKPFV